MNLKFKISNLKFDAGFSIVEALLAGSVFSLLATAIIGAIIYANETSAVGGNRSRAVFIAEEGLEAVKNIKDAGFANLINGAHGLAVSGNQWVLTGSSDAVGDFTRTIQISEVDGFRKNIISTVSWQDTPTRSGSVAIATLLTNWLRSVGGWINPFQQASLDLSGAIDGIKVQVSGNYAYVVRNDSVPDFLVINVSNPASPSVAGSLTLSGAPTNIFVSGNNAYVSSRDNSAELQIIDITAPASPSLAGSFNALGNSDGLGVFAVGTTVFLTRASGADQEFIVIDASAPALPIGIGSIDLSGGGNEVYVSGGHAYVASTSNSQELIVINIAVPAAPSIVGSYDIAGNTDALTVMGSGSTVFLGRAANLYIFNVSAPAAPSLLFTYPGAGTINDIALNLGTGNYLHFATANSNKEFEVIDVSIPSSPQAIGGLNLTGLNGIAYDSALDRAFAVGESDTAEFIVISPQL